MIIPSFIYQLIDHIYVSDVRAFSFYDQFDLVIRTDFIFTSSPLSISIKGKTKLITSTKGSIDQHDEIIMIMKEYTMLSKKILLYSNDWSSICKIFLYYISRMYQFSSIDMYHMVNSSRFPDFLSVQMNQVLSTMT